MNTPTPQVTFAPRCPQCGAVDVPICRSKACEIKHAGRLHHAQKQYRRCRPCGHGFACVHVKGLVWADLTEDPEPVPDGKKRRHPTGPWAQGAYA